MKIELKIGKVVELENGLMYKIERESTTPMGSKIYGNHAIHYEWTTDGTCLHNGYGSNVRRCADSAGEDAIWYIKSMAQFVIRRVRNDGKVIECATTDDGEIADNCGNRYPTAQYLRFWNIMADDQFTIFPSESKMSAINSNNMVFTSEGEWHHINEQDMAGDGGYTIGGKIYNKHGIYHYGKHISYIKKIEPYLTDRTLREWALQQMRLGQKVRAINWKDETAYFFMKNGRIYEHATIGSGMTENEFIKNVSVVSSWEAYNPITLTMGHVCALVGGKWGQIGSHNRVVIDNDIVIEYSMHGRPMNIQIGDGEIKEIPKPEAGMYISYTAPMPTYGTFRWALVNRALGFTVSNRKMGIVMHPTQNCPQPDEDWLEDMMELMHQDMYEGWE